MVRVPTDQEFGQWKVALESQTADNVKATYVTPVLDAPPHPRKVGLARACTTQLNMKFQYSKTCLKQPLKKNTKNWFSIPIIA